MANLKLSQIAAGTTPALTDTVIGVQGGTTDAQLTLSQISATVLAIGNPVTSGTTGSILFIDGSSHLAQDNANFFWDDTNFRLEIGHSGATTTAIYVNTLPALFEVPNPSGNNWFEDNAGNFTVTGFSNLGTGDGALAAVTTGSQNTAIGTHALNKCTSGFANFAFGFEALFALTTGNNNVAIGVDALATTISDQQNTAIGSNALAAVNGGSNNTAIGGGCGDNITTGNQNTFVGSAVGNGVTTGSANVSIGFQTLQHYNDSSSVVIGNSTGAAITSGPRNTMIGNNSVPSITSGGFNTFLGSTLGGNLTGSCVGNVWVGSFAAGPSAAVNDTIYIATGADFSFPVGVDLNLTTSRVWSFQYGTAATGLHVYNTTDNGFPPTNYERGALDWNLTSNIFRLASQAGGTGTVRLIAVDGFQKAGAPAAGDLPSGTFALINDTSGGNTWLVYNNAGTIRKVQLV